MGTADERWRQASNAFRKPRPLKNEPPRIVPCNEMEGDAVRVLFLITLQNYEKLSEDCFYNGFLTGV